MAGAIAPPPVAAAPPTPIAPPPAQGGSSALKIILIVIGVIFLLGVLGIGTMVFVVRRIAHNTHFKNKDGNVRVETPFGTVQSTSDPDEAARNLGIDQYPGAKVTKGNSATIGGMHTVDAEFESNDSPEKVMAFYSSRFPGANVSNKDTDGYTIVSTNNNNLITIKIQSEDGKTRIKIANVSGKNMMGGNSSN